MASDPRQSAGAFAAQVMLRAAAIGGLIFAALYLAQTRHLYATALVLLGLALLIGFDLVRIAAGADRLMANFIDGLLAEGAERPTARQAGAVRVSQAIDRALDRVTRSRIERQGRIDYLQTLADTVVAVLVVIDDQGRIEWANQTARKLHGERVHDLTILAGGDAAVAAKLAALRPGERQVVNLPDGARLVSVSGFQTSGGKQRRLIALQRLSGDLDAVELKAWRDISRILSHEMMNSLTPICSLADSSARMIRESDGGDTEIAQALEVIARRGEGLMSFVDRYRRLAELPAPAKAPLPAKVLLARIDGLMQALAKAQGVAYASAAQPTDLVLEVDGELLEQAVINLVKNAIEAAEGQPDAAVSLNLAVDGGEVVIAVQDNGPGLAAEDVEAAFVPFFSRKSGGSGIGLSLARQIALAHGGRVEYADLKPGAAFRLMMPAPAHPIDQLGERADKRR